jgi:hypothetical protein
MSQVFTKLQEIESQIDGEMRQIDRKLKDLRVQRQKLSNLRRALKPKTFKKKKVEKVEGGTEQ